MKSISRFIIVLPFLLMLQLYCFSQNDTLIKPGYASVAILMVDYDTYSFEGGNLSHYTCPSCSNDSLPFFISLNGHSSDDFEITFTLSTHFDTILNSSTVWMGLGVLKYPTIFSSDYPFQKTNISVPKPIDASYVSLYGTETNEPEFIIQADSAWKIIDSLEIVNLFSDNGFKTCIFLYAPTIGMFDPKVAKWMIFLYAQDKTYSNEETSDMGKMSLYPNPVNNVLYFPKDKWSALLSAYKIFDSNGQLVKQMNSMKSLNQIDVASLSNSLYLLVLFDKRGNVVETQKILKE